MNYIDNSLNSQDNFNKSFSTYFNEVIMVSNNNLFVLNKTLFVTHSSSYKHGEISLENADWIMRIKRREYQVENPDRLSVLLEPCTGILQSDFFKKTCEFEVTKEEARLVDILRVHDFNYIDSVRSTCEELKANNKNKMYKYDSDTYINQHTWESAIYGAGTVIHAVDRVMSGDYKNALCLVRPPGHHAGYYGKVE